MPPDTPIFRKPNLLGKQTSPKELYALTESTLFIFYLLILCILTGMFYFFLDSGFQELFQNKQPSLSVTRLQFNLASVDVTDIFLFLTIAILLAGALPSLSLFIINDYYLQRQNDTRFGKKCIPERILLIISGLWVFSAFYLTLKDIIYPILHAYKIGESTLTTPSYLYYVFLAFSIYSLLVFYISAKRLDNAFLTPKSYPQPNALRGRLRLVLSIEGLGLILALVLCYLCRDLILTQVNEWASLLYNGSRRPPMSIFELQIFFLIPYTGTLCLLRFLINSLFIHYTHPIELDIKPLSRTYFISAFWVNGTFLASIIILPFFIIKSSTFHSYSHSPLLFPILFYIPTIIYIITSLRNILALRKTICPTHSNPYEQSPIHP